ncbi:rna-directed dna polymerase from mobile element jockey-like [Pitangus sulphuratus]|nr:rna-directed dna polymerase from mobile element jockey-like [Pitangus sulphuratus]
MSCTPGKFADRTKLCGVIDTLEERSAIQRDLERFERWAYANPVKFSKVKCKVLHLDHHNPKHTCKLSGEVIESSSAEKELRVLVDE